MRIKLFNAIKVSALALLLSFGLSFVYAWTAPTSNPPAGNVSAPINTSATAQTKVGSLTISATTTTNWLQVVSGAGVGKVLTSDANGIARWVATSSLSLPGGLPAGGTTGQVITKQADGTANWQAPTGGMVILLTDAQKIAYYSGHGVNLQWTAYHACNSSALGGYGCTFTFTYDGAVEHLEARSDGLIYITHVPYTGYDCGGWTICGTGYTDYPVWNYLTNTKAGSGVWVAPWFLTPGHWDYDVNGCATCSKAVTSPAGTDFNVDITGVFTSGINTVSAGLIGWQY